MIVTAAEIVSPGRTVSFSRTGGAGRISYQASYWAVFEDVQFDSVPVCSSELAVSSNPPSPTQKAE